MWRSLLKTLFTGVVTSPNHPGKYPHNLDKTHTIEVESGKKLRLTFTRFAVWGCGDACSSCDYLKITDGDGTILMEKSCGSENPTHPWYYMPPIITSRSHRVDIFFHSDDDGWAYTGWSLSWTAVPPGVKALF